jgi:peptide/nickel transport system permease protein
MQPDGPVGDPVAAVDGGPSPPAIPGSAETTAGATSVRWRVAHPVWFMVWRRALVGVATLVVVSIVVFAATEVLPGNAAYAILGHNATPARLQALEAQLHLNRGLFEQYWIWLTGLLSGKLGTSLANGSPVWAFVQPRLVNSAFLVLITGAIGSVLGVAMGAVAAVRKDGWFDHVTSAVSLAVTSLPEFVVAIALIIVFATLVSHLLPAVSVLPPGTYAWSQPRLLVLPVATLVIVIVPYIHRMMMAAMTPARIAVVKTGPLPVR